MSHVIGNDPGQMRLWSPEEHVATESEVRLIRAFVDSLDLTALGIGEEQWMGRPMYERRGLLGLLIYGYKNRIRSSRALEKACLVNVEVMWLMREVTPDHRTIADFRKAHAKDLKKLFKEFNKRIESAVESGYKALDGSKFGAHNAKSKNFTRDTLEARLKREDAKIDEYLKLSAEMDAAEEAGEELDGGKLTRSELDEKLAALEERVTKLKDYKEYMEKNNLSQMSLTDADSKIMHTRKGFQMSYNPQTAVDSKTHLISDFEMTNAVSDIGQLEPTMKNVAKGESGIVEVVADTGYQQPEDMVACLENGILPHVIPKGKATAHDLSVPFEACEDADPTSTQPEDLKKCLRSGVVPDAYKDVISDMEVKEVRKFVADATETQESTHGSKEEMIARAKEGYFVRDAEQNQVYCPNGATLHPKGMAKNDSMRYRNPIACPNCPLRNKCFGGKSKCKEVAFSKDDFERPCPGVLGKEKAQGIVRKRPKGHFEKKKVVQFKLTPDPKKTKQRKCLSEHPFGTMKRSMGCDHFLLNGLEKVTGEFSLFCLGYNLTRAKNLLGFAKLMEQIQTA